MTGDFLARAEDTIRKCRTLADCTDQPGVTTRTFLSPAMHKVHALVKEWMEQAGLTVHVDAAGNIRGTLAGTSPTPCRLLIGSHLDTVPNAGAFDGILGVIIGLTITEMFAGRRPRNTIEIIGFSDEEGVRFGIPFIGSRAVAGSLTNEVMKSADARGVSLEEAIRAFGLDPGKVQEAEAHSDARGYVEFHIEQGPVLEQKKLPVGVVDAIVGQSRREIIFEGQASHAGTTPMSMRSDALAGAAEWIGVVEREARTIPDLVATVGKLDVQPGAGNVIPGSALASLDVRHKENSIRSKFTEEVIRFANDIAKRRKLGVTIRPTLDQPSVSMDRKLTDLLAKEVESAGFPAMKMASGAGHDAMVVAEKIPSTMLFLRSPGGISHHPDETVLATDVAVALEIGSKFVRDWDAQFS
ncbi:MAG TPA: allantoate amidohydrolase [Bacteroidota bacterium]|nr:allantoate amidohydrolase [Bacteroidota bacterium]